VTSTPVQSQDDRAQSSAWSHLTLSTLDLDDAQVARKINSLGNDGWELVDVENFSRKGDTVKTVYYFKKPG
jgi:hypothetical protein